ncbi:MAG: VOC family protein, partial [Nitrososphaerota archaeon]|nr:VOC family protein [Nitrososphaerota archaeon]
MRAHSIVGQAIFLKAKFVYTGIRVKDLKESLDFYTKVLGMRVASRSKIPVAKGEVVNRS